MKKLLLLLLGLLTVDALVAQTLAPEFNVIHKKKPIHCDGKGLTLHQGYVASPLEDEMIDLVIYLQRYDGTWITQYYEHKGAGAIELDVDDCEYTGTLYTYAAYQKDGGKAWLPTLEVVKKTHEEREAKTLFRVTRVANTKMADCGNGVLIEEGELSTKNGEKVRITLFLEMTNGGWRKKDYVVWGSGEIELDIADCTLTGKYKATWVIESQ